MTELPPIIERLDALKAEAVRLIDAGYTESGRQAKAEMANYYEEMRAELLRLQAERNRWQRSHEDLRHLLKDCRDRGDVVERERNALLEALKEIVEIGGDGVASQEARIAMQAIADVEGKDG